MKNINYINYVLKALDIADLVIEKQFAYGNSFEKSGEVMRILYPNGIKPEQMDDALTIVRILDKLFRVAHKKDAFGESPYRDIMGYALLAVERDENTKSGGENVGYICKCKNCGEEYFQMTGWVLGDLPEGYCSRCLVTLDFVEEDEE